MPTGDETTYIPSGYFAGGYDAGAEVSGIDKITVPAETKSTLSATLSSARWGLSGMANWGVGGYFAGGFPTSGLTSIIDKITIPADTVSTLSATLTQPRRGFGGMANSAVAGYYAGGNTHPWWEYLSGIDKITFPADTKSTLSATLTTARIRGDGYG